MPSQTNFVHWHLFIISSLFLMLFFYHHRNSCHHLIFKHKSFDSVKQKEENEENCQVLDPCHLDQLPESWSVPYIRLRFCFIDELVSVSQLLIK